MSHGTPVGGRLRQLADRRHELVEDHLRPTHERLVDEADRLAPLVVDAHITTDQEAVRAPAKVRDAWARLGQIDEQLTALGRCAGILRARHVGILAPLPDDTPHYRHPDRVRGVKGRHRTEWFAETIAAGAEPVFLTAEEAKALIKQQRAEAHTTDIDAGHQAA